MAKTKQGREARQRQGRGNAQQIGENEFVGLGQEEVNHRKKGFPALGVGDPDTFPLGGLKKKKKKRKKKRPRYRLKRKKNDKEFRTGQVKRSERVSASETEEATICPNNVPPAYDATNRYNEFLCHRRQRGKLPEYLST